jgi:hypothetical protein
LETNKNSEQNADLFPCLLNNPKNTQKKFQFFDMATNKVMLSRDSIWHQRLLRDLKASSNKRKMEYFKTSEDRHMSSTIREDPEEYPAIMQ